MNLNKKRKTVGQLSQELTAKDDYAYSPIDLGRKMLEGYDSMVHEAVEKGLKELTTGFYVVILTGKPAFYERTITRYPFVRRSCPTPETDQTVFRFDRKNNTLEELWTIPDKETCAIMMNNASQVDPKEWQLLGNIYQYHNGNLLKMAKKLNKEID
jgi:hypothetical protein